MVPGKALVRQMPDVTSVMRKKVFIQIEFILDTLIPAYMDVSTH